MFIFDLFRKPKSINAEKLYEDIKIISNLTDDINKKSKQLAEKEYEILLRNKDEVFISLADFLNLIDIKNLTIKDIISYCTHASEIKTNDASVVELYAITDTNHIILCSDTTTCEIHKKYKGNKIKIITLRNANHG